MYYFNTIKRDIYREKQIDGQNKWTITGRLTRNKRKTERKRQREHEGNIHKTDWYKDKLTIKEIMTCNKGEIEKNIHIIHNTHIEPKTNKQ